MLLCCPKIDSNGVGDVGECWAILGLFCWGIGLRVLIASGYGLFPSHDQRLGLCHINQTNLSNVDYCYQHGKGLMSRVECTHQNLG